MTQKKSCIFNWSGGKDSSLALYHCLNNPELDIKYLVTTLNHAANRVSMHGVGEELLIEQAKAIGIPLYQIRLPEMPGMKEYDETMRKHLKMFKDEGINYAVFGDIFLEDLKRYREERLAEAGMQGIFPLWQRNTTELMDEFLNLGFKTVVVCTQERIKQFAGRVIDRQFISELPPEIDVCGENGEFHTFVFNGPIFKQAVQFETGERCSGNFQNPKTKKMPVLQRVH